MGSLTSKETKNKPKPEDSVTAERRKKCRFSQKGELPIVLVRQSSMYFDEDGDLAHAFYEEVFFKSQKGKAFMKRITRNLRPQGWIQYPYPRLGVDSPEVLVEVR